ncbi:MAG TPA: hypothetical protein VGB00_02590, partial [Pyrinomonadaceae bacterium]
NHLSESACGFNPDSDFLRRREIENQFLPGFGSDDVGPAIALLIAGVILIGFWFARSRNFSAAAPVLSAPFSSENLSTNGKVLFAVISPDGKNVIYTNGTGGDKQSVWLRQLETGSNVEIIPPSAGCRTGKIWHTLRLIPVL